MGLELLVQVVGFAVRAWGLGMILFLMLLEETLINLLAAFFAFDSMALAADGVESEVLEQDVALAEVRYWRAYQWSQRRVGASLSI